MTVEWRTGLLIIIAVVAILLIASLSNPAGRGFNPGDCGRGHGNVAHQDCGDD
jgi:hypothetical protein